VQEAGTIWGGSIGGFALAKRKAVFIHSTCELRVRVRVHSRWSVYYCLNLRWVVELRVKRITLMRPEEEEVGLHCQGVTNCLGS
jgi:hypothetical protein